MTLLLQTLLPDQSSWFNTGVYSLELLIHQRLRRHPCLTKDPTRAQLFYIPFYACECPARGRTFPSGSSHLRVGACLPGSKRPLGCAPVDKPAQEHKPGVARLCMVEA